jgi:hypothetical protein
MPQKCLFGRNVSFHLMDCVFDAKEEGIFFLLFAFTVIFQILERLNIIFMLH